MRECETFCCAAEFSGPDREHASFNDNIDNNISAPGVDNTNYSSDPGVEESNHVADTVVSVTQARATLIVSYLREATTRHLSLFMVNGSGFFANQPCM